MRFSYHCHMLNSCSLSECVVPAIEESKFASYSADTAIPRAIITYKCNEGYSFEEATWEARNELELTCNYNTDNGAFISQSQKQCLSKRSFNFAFQFFISCTSTLFDAFHAL